MENRSLMKQEDIQRRIAISNSFVKASKSDLNSSRILLKNKEFSNSLYHSQQAIEKILKAMLALKGRFIFKHEVVAEFCNVFRKSLSSEFIDLVKEKGFELEQEGSSLRYPDFSGAEIFDPTEEFTKEDADNGYKIAKNIVTLAVKEIKIITALMD